MAALIEGFSSFTSYFNKPLTTDQALGLQRLLTEIDKRIPLLTTYSLDSVLAHIYAIGLDAHDQYDLDNLIINLDAELDTLLAEDDLTDPLMILERLLRDRAVNNTQDAITAIPDAVYDSANTISKESRIPASTYTYSGNTSLSDLLLGSTFQDVFDVNFKGDVSFDLETIIPNEVILPTPTLDLDFKTRVPQDVRVRRDEYVTNGDMSSSAGWTLTGSASISAGTLSFSGGVGKASQGNILTPGKTYTALIEIESHSAGSVVVHFGTAVSTGVFGGAGAYVYTAVCAGSDELYVDTADFVGDVGSFSVTLVEETATVTRENGYITLPDHNLFTDSSNIGGGNWGNTRVVSTLNDIVAPDGTLTGTKVSGDNAPYAYPDIHFDDAVIGEVYTMSVFAKAGTLSHIDFIAHGDNNGYWHGGAIFDLENGDIHPTLNAAPSPIDSGMEYVGDGWYLCWITVVAIDTALDAFIYLSNNIAWATVYGPDDYLYVWGCQLTKGPKPLVAADLTGYTETTNTPKYWGNVGRINHDSAKVTWRTNLIQYSGQFNKWLVNATAVVGVDNVADPHGGMDAQTITWGNSHVDQRWQQRTYMSGEKLTFSVWARVASGVSSFRLHFFDGAVYNASPDFTVTTTWQRFTATHVSTTTGLGNVSLMNASIANSDTIEFYGPQLEEGEVATDYIRTTAFPVTAVDTYAIPKGILIEEQRENVATFSKDLTDATWQPQSSTVTPSSVRAPDGSTMFKFIPDVGSSFSRLLRYGLVDIGTWCFSIFLKRGDFSIANIQMYSVESGGLSIDFNFDTETITSVTGALVNLRGSGVIPYPNGVFRVWVAMEITGTTLAQWNPLRMDATENTQADGVKGTYCWGPQLEKGSFPTSYIPTGNTPVVRKSDLVNVPGIGWFNVTKGTFRILGEAFSNKEGILMELSDGTSGERLYLKKTDTDVQLINVTGGITNVDLRSQISPLVFESTFSYQADNFQAYTVGDNILESDGISPIPTVTELNIGNQYDASKSYNGHVERLVYYGGLHDADHKYNMFQLTDGVNVLGSALHAMFRCITLDKFESGEFIDSGAIPLTLHTGTYTPTVSRVDVTSSDIKLATFTSMDADTAETGVTFAHTMDPLASTITAVIPDFIPVEKPDGVLVTPKPIALTTYKG